jgi:hypothetical protein
MEQGVVAKRGSREGGEPPTLVCRGPLQLPLSAQRSLHGPVMAAAAASLYKREVRRREQGGAGCHHSPREDVS